MILTLSGSSGCGSGGRHSDFRSFSSCSVCKARREQEQWPCTELTFVPVPAAQLLPEPRRMLKPQARQAIPTAGHRTLQPLLQPLCSHLPPPLLCQFLLLHFLLLLLLPLPFLLLLALLFLVRTQGCQICLVLLLPQDLGLVSLFPANMSKKWSGLTGPKVRGWQAEGRPEGAGTASNSQEHTAGNALRYPQAPKRPSQVLTVPHTQTASQGWVKLN